MKKDKEYWKKIRKKSGQRQKDFRGQKAGKAEMYQELIRQLYEEKKELESSCAD